MLWLGHVSISSEMPAPWRPCKHSLYQLNCLCFNLKRDASPVATYAALRTGEIKVLFQSQARCQPRGDVMSVVSRKKEGSCFNLKRDASPVATARAASRSSRSCLF